MTDSISLSIGTGDRGEMVMRITAVPQGVAPAAYIVLVVDTDLPNAYEEFEAVTSVLTDEFMEITSGAMREWIAEMSADASPEVVETLQQKVRDDMLLQGFSPEQIDEIERRAAE